MAGNALNVTAGKPNTSGAVFTAPAGSTLPTSASATLDTAFKDMGFVSEDGVTKSTSISTTTIKEWGGAPVLVTQDEKIISVKLKLIEYKRKDIHSFVHGSANITESNGAITIRNNANDPGEQAMVIDMILRGNIPYRMVIPRGKITSIGDIVYKTNEAIGYDIEITTMLDDSGNSVYEYIAAAAASGTTGTT
jgi:hypothetical protein